MGFLLVGVQVPPLAPSSLLRRTLCVVIAIAMLGTACDGPKHVVERAIAAAAENDQEKFLACFTTESRATLEMLWRTRRAPLATGKAQVLRVVPVGAPSLAAVEIEENGVPLILIVQGRAGVWRIDLFNTEAALTDQRAPF